jgi:cytochrome P450
MKTPLGPHGHFLLGHTRDIQHNSPYFFLRLAREYGDVARIRILSKPLYLVSHPDAIRLIFQKNHLNYDRNSFTYKLLRTFFGDSLALSDGAFWQQQRRLMQPAFHKQRIAGMATQMTKIGKALLKRWENRPNQDEPLNIQKEMSNVMLSIISMTFLDLDFASEYSSIGQTLQTILEVAIDYIYLPCPLMSMPTSRNRRIRAALSMLDTCVYDLIRQRREQKANTEGLFSLLQTSREDGAGMNDQQLRNEIVSLLFAGYGNIANMLTWAWYELSRHPEVEHRFWEEIDTVLHGEHLTLAHLPQLRYTRMVIDEVLRLYPLAVGVPRRTLVDDTICGYRIPAKQVVVANIYAAQRHPAYWEQPETFDPDRFSPEHPCEGVRRSYFPFGGGHHLCMGNNLTLMVAQILLPMVAQRYRLQLARDQTVEPVQKLILCPGHDLFMLLKERK